jgi:putative nucleotidyltransferase with HDIG domain
MKKQIVFVDDNSNVLDGLRRMNRTERGEWDAYYTSSGVEALKIMEDKRIDLIVADLRMPGMDGAELLREVMKRRPEVIRIVLSGQAESDMIMSLVGVAHQFVSKPCDPQVLKSVINRAIGLRALLKNNSLEGIVSELDALPSVPTLYLEMMKELQSADPSIRKAGEIISRDPGMAAKILQLTNSAFFGLRRSVSNPADAVAYLGLDRIQHLFLALQAFSQFVPRAEGAFSMDLLWEHSLSTAALAKTIAEKEGGSKETVQDAFTAGLLHDIGKLMLACRLADKHMETVELARKTAVPLWVAEQQILSITHAEIGAYLLGLWGLPDGIIEAVGYHHRPADSGNEVFCALTALHLADCCNTNLSQMDLPAPQLDAKYLSGVLQKSEINDLNAYLSSVDEASRGGEK